MIGYRVYRLNAEGHVLSRAEFEAPDDDTALVQAHQQMLGHDVEVWQLGRLVGSLQVADYARASH
jgi:hypothetical protein